MSAYASSPNSDPSSGIPGTATALKAGFTAKGAKMAKGKVVSPQR